MNYIKIYTNFLKKRLNLQKKLRVVFDCSNGTTGLVLNKLLKTKSLPRSSSTSLLRGYKLKAILLNDNPDGNFPAHSPDPLKRFALSDLQKSVKKQKADLGVIFDADGDRVFFIDNLGRFVEPDIISRLLIWHLKPKKIVIDTRTGWLIKKNQKLKIKNQNDNSKFKIYESKIGHYYIKKLMRKINADFGAEKSGHYYFKIINAMQKMRMHANAANNLFYYDSGILAAIEVINAVSKLPYSLADFNDLLPQYYRSGEINIKIPDAKLRIDANAANNILKKVEKHFIPHFSSQISHISHTDGLIIEFERKTNSDGRFRSALFGCWFNLRPSNTEPFLRLNAEADSPKTLDILTKKILNLLRNSKYFELRNSF